MSHKNTLKRTLYFQENNAATFFFLSFLQCLLPKPISSELLTKIRNTFQLCIWSMQICRESVFERGLPIIIIILECVFQRMKKGSCSNKAHNNKPNYSSRRISRSWSLDDNGEEEKIKNLSPMKFFHQFSASLTVELKRCQVSVLWISARSSQVSKKAGKQGLK